MKEWDLIQKDLLLEIPTVPKRNQFAVYVQSYPCATLGCPNRLLDHTGFKRSRKSKQFCKPCLKARKNEQARVSKERRKNETN